MNEYYVKAPLLAVISVTVEAENEEDAKRIAFEKFNDATLKSLGDGSAEASIDEWDIMEQVSQGNFYFGNINEVEIECSAEDINGDDSE